VALQLLGSLLAIAALLALGRSFGIVRRSSGHQIRWPLSTRPARAVRELSPGANGLLAENPTYRDLVILGLVLVAQVIRINHEEQQLATDAAYSTYRQRVRYRLIPHIY
jgi:protein-S-isoprenylcysteine O-methyltransferase Ste14